MIIRVFRSGTVTCQINESGDKLRKRGAMFVDREELYIEHFLINCFVNLVTVDRKRSLIRRR